jgi:RNA recognition motif-containing protein
MSVEKPSSMHVTRRVFVGNVEFNTGWKSIKEHMKGAGEVKRVEVLKDSRGKPRGCAIVTYTSPLEASRAIQQLDGSCLADRSIQVREDYGRRSRSPRKPCQVYLSNLPYNTSWWMIKDACRSCGHVSRVDLPKEEDKCKGYAFVVFSSEKAAQRAVEQLNNSEFHGRRIFAKLDNNKC